MEKEKIEYKEKIKSIESDIKKVIENRGFWSVFILRETILKEEIKDVKKVIKKLNLEELLKLKYTLKLRLLNYKLHTFSLIVITVCLTEFIKDLLIRESHNYFLTVLTCIIFIYFIGIITDIIFFNQSNGLFIRDRKKEILIGLIDFEIKKR